MLFTNDEKDSIDERLITLPSFNQDFASFEGTQNPHLINYQCSVSRCHKCIPHEHNCVSVYFKTNNRTTTVNQRTFD